MIRVLFQHIGGVEGIVAFVLKAVEAVEHPHHLNKPNIAGRQRDFCDRPEHSPL